MLSECSCYYYDILNCFKVEVRGFFQFHWEIRVPLSLLFFLFLIFLLSSWDHRGGLVTSPHSQSCSPHSGLLSPTGLSTFTYNEREGEKKYFGENLGLLWRMTLLVLWPQWNTTKIQFLLFSLQQNTVNCLLLLATINIDQRRWTVDENDALFGGFVAFLS